MARTPTAVPGVDRSAEKAKLDLDRDGTPSDAGLTDVETGGTARPGEASRSSSHPVSRPGHSSGNSRATDGADGTSRVDGAGGASEPTFEE